LSEQQLFTVGHSNHSIERFMELLRQHRIEVIVDVRSNPASSRNPQFNRESLKASLGEAGIKYLFLGKELGARRSEREAYDGNVASYERIAKLPAFKEGLDRVKSGVNTYRVALMCAEKDPIDCHRTLLVCRHLREALPGRIQHILADGALESHGQTERRLLVNMGVSADQDEMFVDETEPPLERAYRKRGLTLAYQEETVGGD
jgi:uncharacterized protein (DUF488 family)